jgi:hypothetical protein
MLASGISSMTLFPHFTPYLFHHINGILLIA